MNPKGLLLSGALMAALCVSAAPLAPKQNSEATAIGTERAIATAQAKAAPTAITKLVVKRDQDDTTQVETYEIELRAAADGTILAQKQEAENPNDREEDEDEEDDNDD